MAALDDDVQAELGHVFPSLSALASGREVALQHERYRCHRAVRELLDRLAVAKPLVLVLDDLHWADAASVELLAALLRRPPAAAWLAGAELYLDRYRDADAHAERALAVGRATGQGELFLVLVQVLGRVWFVRGKLAQAAELLDGGIEAARLLHNNQALVWNLFNRSFVALARGDIELALATAHESVELSDDFEPGFHSAWAAVRLADALLETDQAERAVDLLLGRAGGEELVLIPGSWRAYCLELLTRCWLTLDHRAEARRAAARAEAWAASVQLPLAEAWADRAAAAAVLDDGDAAGAAERALASAAAAAEVGAPIESALSRKLAGRAFAEAQQRDRAIAELQRAATELDESGALRYRDAAERELGKLGHRIHRRTCPGKTNGTGLESLTGRELEVARLVVDRRDESRDRGRAVPQPQDCRDPPPPHLRKDERHIARGPRSRRRAGGPNRERATELTAAGGRGAE